MKYMETLDPHLAVLLQDDGTTIAQIGTPNPNAETVARDLQRTYACLAQAVAVIKDFLPNVRRCVLQDYARLNDVLVESSALLRHSTLSEDDAL